MKKLNIIPLLVALSTMLFSASTTGYKPGDTVKDFQLKNTDGNFISLSQYSKDKGVIIIFDCNTCPYSKLYNTRIIALNKKYQPLGFPVVAINANDPGQSPGDSFEEMVRIAKRKSYTFPYLFDETQEVAKAFGATNTPHVFILNKDGNSFRLAYIGAIDNNARDESKATKHYVQETVEALLNGNSVPAVETKAIGCGIKFRS